MLQHTGFTYLNLFGLLECLVMLPTLAHEIKLLKQSYRYHKLRKTFSKFYRHHYDIVSKFNEGLKSLLKQGLSEPEFYVDLVYKFRKYFGRNDFSDQFRKIIIRYKRIGYNMNVIRYVLRAWLLAQSRLTTLLPSLIARQRVGP